MGYIRHDAIIVTSFDKDHLKRARDKAVELGLPCTDTALSTINRYVSFLIAPDGSKEGWETSSDADQARSEWISWARSASGVYINWIHINYGGDDSHLAQIIDWDGKEPVKGDGE